MSSNGARRLRVAMISFGFGEVCMRIANALSREADVSLLLPDEEVVPLRGALDARVHVVSYRMPRLRQPLRQIAMCRTILRAIRRLEPDVVHVQQGHLYFNLALPLLRTYPLVVTIHDHTHHLGDRASKRTPQVAMNVAFRRADRVIVHAERLKREAVELRGLPEAIVHVIPHVAIGDLVPPPPVSEEAATVLFFGRIWPYKGLDYLIRAAPLISDRVPEVRFVVAGEGEDFAHYRRLMRDPARFIVHNEFVSIEKRAELFARAAVVVLPYVEASQSGVVPVAYSFGKPVVATAVGGLPEAIDDGMTGYLVPPRDERALADAIVRLLREPDLRRRLGEGGRRKLEDECSPGTVADQTLAVYELALRRGNGEAR